ncbi:MAG: NUDIX domain-containing protein [Planctomycetota bacterium]|nr:NUDIX domain-containing protein [Planctomycetota bacterium]
MNQPYGILPAEFGDLGLRHEVDVFVYRFGAVGPEYLLLRHEPQHEEAWRPVTGSVGLNEDLRRAAMRRVRAELGLDYAHDLVAPPSGLLEEIGDLQLVHWPVGFQLARGAELLRPQEHVTALQWAVFAAALEALNNGAHRRNLLQLHLRIAA